MHPKRILQTSLRTIRKLLNLNHPQRKLHDSILADLQVTNPPPFETALFNFTIDFELLWGNGEVEGSEHSLKRRLDSAQAQVDCFGAFVEMLKNLQFPISWAILGKLAQSEVSIEESQKFHPNWSQSDWYQIPEAAVQRPELWKGEPYLTAIQRDLPHSEILSHGYAHIDYSDPSTTEQIAESDIILSKKVLQDFGFQVDGFVYPCNRHRFNELLPQCGFSIARGPDQHWHLRPQSPVWMTPIGFWISPGMMSYRDVHALIQEGIRRRSFIHPWMHLIECSVKHGDIRDFYQPVFESILEAQSRGKIENISFKTIQTRLNSHL
jgi:peptidoglycan/xylan/chitin deacetylase (PgdA/CDA1 family)